MSRFTAFPQPLPVAVTTKPDARTRNTAIALLAAAAVMLFGLTSHAWCHMWSELPGEGVGLIGVGSWAHNMSWFDLPVPAELKMFAAIGILGLTSSIAFLVHAAVMLLRRRPHDVMIKRLNASLGIAAFGCTSLFIYLTFGQFARGFSVSYAGILTLASLAITSLVIAKLVRPISR